MLSEPMEGPAPVVRSTASPHASTSADETRSPGGPQTPEGRARSRENALDHGLTAKSLVQQAFPDGEIDQFRAAFREEWQPVTPTQHLLIDEMARHAAALSRAQRMETAVLRQAAWATLELSVGQDRYELSSDLLLAGAVGGEGIDRLTRYRRCHEKAFFAALSKLREVKEHPFHVPAEPRPRIDTFQTETDCEIYLRRRLQSSKFRCPDCAGTVGFWLSGRQRRQCAACHRQFGLRTGTVMAGSPLPLRVWFEAIRLVIQGPNVSTRTFAEALGIRRLATARSVLGRIRVALSSANISQSLAGLELVFARGTQLQQAPLAAAILQNELDRPANSVDDASACITRG